MLTTSVSEKQHRSLEELVEQINAVYNALEISRQRYELYLKEKEKPAPQPQTAKSSWNISSSPSGKASSGHEHTLHVLPPDQHPIVLGIWATSSSDSSYRNTLGRVLQELLLEKRKHMREMELAGVNSSAV
ncbi:hypothetical protein BGZ58_005870 [Dissophora ornata]|nr:hypothetical protein BGZ58_005870 [Dissophora ornata]